MSLKAVDLKPRIGAEIFADRDALLNGEHGQELRELLDRRGILLFRGIHLSAEEQMQVSRTIGTLFEPRQADHSSVQKISMDKNIMKEADYFKGSFLWHFDGAIDPIPPRASLLSALSLSQNGGGETEFANSSAAYEDLPEEKKRLLDKARVFHSLRSPYRIAKMEPDEKTMEFWANSNPVPHSYPLVWHHESGRRNLMVGSSACDIQGEGLEEGEELRLLEWVTQPKYVYRHAWEVGDMIVYDNTGVLHRALPYDSASGRVLQRTMLVGEEECV